MRYHNIDKTIISLCCSVIVIGLFFLIVQDWPVFRATGVIAIQQVSDYLGAGQHDGKD